MSTGFLDPTQTQTTQGTRSRVSSATSVVATFAPGEMIGERFRIVRLIGQGGMGQVFEAEDTELGARVALKVIRPDLARHERSIERFKREVHLARQVTHPNVCRIFDLFQHDSARSSPWGKSGQRILFLTMELVRGRTLAQHIRQQGPLDPAEALPLIRGMAAALDAAHDAGVVHRDFKSSNVLLVDGETGRRAVVTDFGLAQPHVEEHGEEQPTGLRPSPATSGHRPRPTALRGAGTPAYLAPEVAAGHEATPAADIYSFGVVIFEMLTAVLPCRGKSPEKTQQIPMVAEPTRLRSHRPDLTRRWEAAVERCQERLPEARFRRAGEGALALDGGKLRRTKIAAAVAAVLLAAAAIVWRTPTPGTTIETPPSAAEARHPSVALLGFKNLDANPETSWLSTALLEITASELQAADGLRLIPVEDVRRVKAELNVDEAAAFGVDVVPRLRQYLETDFVVVGSYRSREVATGRELYLEVTLQDAVSGETRLRLRDQAPEGDFVDLASRVAADLRAGLGIGDPPGPARSGLPVSPEGLRLYAWGLERLRRFEFREAREFFEDAATVEPEAARVRLALASSWSALGWETRAVEAARQAFELSAGLARRERLLIEGRYREMIRDWPEAQRIYQELWVDSADDPELGLRLAAVKTAAGEPRAALSTLKVVRNRAARESINPYLDARIDVAEAQAARARGAPERQRRAAARAAATGQALGASLLLAEARLLEAEALHGLGRRQEGAAALTEARRIYEERGDRYSLARALLDLGESLRHDLAKDAGLGMSYEEALETMRELGDRRGTARALIHASRQRQEEEERVRLLDEALALAREIHDLQTEAEGLNVAAGRAYRKDDVQRSVELFTLAAEKARAGGNLILESGYLGNLAGILADSAHPRAREVADRALSSALSTGNLYVTSMTRYKTGYVLVQVGELRIAEKLLRDAMQGAEKIGSLKIQAMAAMALGELYQFRGDGAQAHDFWMTAAERWQDLDDEAQVDACRLAASRALARQGLQAHQDLVRASAASQYWRYRS